MATVLQGAAMRRNDKQRVSVFLQDTPHQNRKSVFDRGRKTTYFAENIDRSVDLEKVLQGSSDTLLQASNGQHPGLAEEDSEGPEDLGMDLLNQRLRRSNFRPEHARRRTELRPANARQSVIHHVPLPIEEREKRRFSLFDRPKDDKQAKEGPTEKLSWAKMIQKQLVSCLKLDEDEDGVKVVTADHVQATRGRPSKYLLKPTSRFFRTWDMLTCLLLVYAAMVTPFEVSFIAQPGQVLHWCNVCVDGCFSVDIVFHFFMPFQDHTGNWVTHHPTIITHYATNFLYIDLLSVFPFHLFDGQSNLRVLRIVKLLRLTKLLRILRGGRVLQRWEASLALDYSVISLITNIGVVCVLAHWFACAWHLIIDLEDNRRLLDPEFPSNGFVNWLNNYSYSSSRDSSYGKYMVSLYWALATLSTLGYGDVVPTTDMERTFVVLCTIIGASVYAYMVGAVCGIVASMDEKNTKFYQQMDALNAFMKEKSISLDLRERLRDYFRFRRHNTVIADNVGLLEAMSPSLRGEVSEQVHSKWITRVDMFKGAPSDFYIDIALSLEAAVYCAKEYVIRENELNQCLYINEKGVVACCNRILISGQWFGEDMLYTLRRRDYFAITLSHTVVLALSRDSLSEILENYGQMAVDIRKHVVKRAVRDTVLSYCKDVQKAWKELKDAPIGDQPQLPKHLWQVKALAFAHIYNLMRRDDEQRFKLCVQSAIAVQRIIRRHLARRSLLMVVNRLKYNSRESRAMFYLLTKLDMHEYKEVFQEERVDIDMLRRLSPGDLRSCHPIPLGDCVRIIDAAKAFDIKTASDNDYSQTMINFYQEQSSSGNLTERRAAAQLHRIEMLRAGLDPPDEEPPTPSASTSADTAAATSRPASRSTPHPEPAMPSLTEEEEPQEDSSSNDSEHTPPPPGFVPSLTPQRLPALREASED